MNEISNLDVIFILGVLPIVCTTFPCPWLSGVVNPCINEHGSLVDMCLMKNECGNITQVQDCKNRQIEQS